MKRRNEEKRWTYKKRHAAPFLVACIICDYYDVDLDDFIDSEYDEEGFKKGDLNFFISLETIRLTDLFIKKLTPDHFAFFCFASGSKQRKETQNKELSYFSKVSFFSEKKCYKLALDIRKAIIKNNKEEKEHLAQLGFRIDEETRELFRVH